MNNPRSHKSKKEISWVRAELISIVLIEVAKLLQKGSGTDIVENVVNVTLR